MHLIVFCAIAGLILYIMSKIGFTALKWCAALVVIVFAIWWVMSGGNVNVTHPKDMPQLPAKTIFF